MHCAFRVHAYRDAVMEIFESSAPFGISGSPRDLGLFAFSFHALRNVAQ